MNKTRSLSSGSRGLAVELRQVCMKAQGSQGPLPSIVENATSTLRKEGHFQWGEGVCREEVTPETDL